MVSLFSFLGWSSLVTSQARDPVGKSSTHEGIIHACVLHSAKVIIITFGLCNTNSKNETEEGYLVLLGTTPKMMVYWMMLSLFLFSFVFPLVVLCFDSVFSVRALWSLSLFFYVLVPVLFASLSTSIFSVFPIRPVAGVLKEILQSIGPLLCLLFPRNLLWFL